MPKKVTKKTFRICYFQEKAKRKKLEKILKILKEDFYFSDFDELVPKAIWYDSEEKQNLIRGYFK